jgi:hypothetical protein
MHTELVSRNITSAARVRSTATDTSGMDIGLMEQSHAERGMAEAFVRTVFLRAYGARIGKLYPMLLTITRDNGEYAAVAGIRPAGSDALFSEQYLDQPVEQLLQTDRAGIAEIGNLAPAGAGQARWLICAVSAFLIGAGYTHVVFTSVPKLRNAFRRLGLPLTRLGSADPQRLPPEQRAEWGSYYQNRPAVYAGDIAAGTPALIALIRSDPELLRLSELAFAAGREFSGNTSASLS